MGEEQGFGDFFPDVFDVVHRVRGEFVGQVCVMEFVGEFEELKGIAEFLAGDLDVVGMEDVVVFEGEVVEEIGGGDEVFEDVFADLLIARAIGGVGVGVDGVDLERFEPRAGARVGWIESERHRGGVSVPGVFFSAGVAGEISLRRFDDDALGLGERDAFEGVFQIGGNVVVEKGAMWGRRNRSTWCFARRSPR